VPVAAEKLAFQWHIPTRTAKEPLILENRLPGERPEARHGCGAAVVTGILTLARPGRRLAAPRGPARGVISAPAGEWPRYAHDAALTRRTPLRGDIASPREAWCISLAGEEVSLELSASVVTIRPAPGRAQGRDADLAGDGPEGRPHLARSRYLGSPPGGDREARSNGREIGLPASGKGDFGAAAPRKRKLSRPMASGMSTSPESSTSSESGHRPTGSRGKASRAGRPGCGARAVPLTGSYEKRVARSSASRARSSLNAVELLRSRVRAARIGAGERDGPDPEEENVQDPDRIESIAPPVFTNCACS
jgi:hypothetical protein